MKQTFYIIKNNSQSEGMYYINGEYKKLYPGEEVTYDHEPTSKTANLYITIYRKEMNPSPILNKKTRR